MALTTTAMRTAAPVGHSSACAAAVVLICPVADHNDGQGGSTYTPASETASSGSEAAADAE